MIIRRRGPRALLSSLALVAGMLAVYVQPVNATLQLLKPTATDPATFSGKGGYSADGLGQIGTGNTVQAQVPAGSTVVQAYLYGTYYGTLVGGPPLEDRTIDFDGTTVVLETLPNSEPGNSGLATARATVTAQVATKVGTGGGITDFAVNTDPTALDGVALVVLFSNATLPDVTIAVLDGGSKQSGDQVTFTFASPINPAAPGFSAIMSLGSGFSFQSGALNPHDCSPDQFSIVKVNTAPLTACAGNWDDGIAANGGLITVGGIGDSTDNPADPENQTGTDDELYNLVPLMKNGDTALVIDTSNPSSDDNLFLAVIQVTAKASVTTEICGNGLDDDGDGLIDIADPDCTADLSVTKTDSPDPVTVGQELTYTITAANAGPSAAQGVTVSDTLPATVTFGSATPSQGTCSGTATVSCALGTLASGASATVTIKVTPTTDADLSNTASVSSTTADPSSANNSDTELTQVDPVSTDSADLSVTKTDSPDPVTVGQELTYTITAANAGPSAAQGVTVSDTLPATVTFGSATPSQGTCSGTATVSCALGTLASGASATVTIKVTPTTDADLSNTASVSSTTADPSSANNSDTELTQVDPVSTDSADLSVTKTDSPDPVTVGQELTYTITAANAGPSAAQGVTVSDTLPATVTFGSATPSQGTCSGTATVSCALGTLASGASATVTIKVTPTTDADLSNTASVSSTTADPSSANNSDTELTQVDPVGGPCSPTDATTTVERISPPPSVKLNRLTSNECVRLFDERQDVTLTRSLKVDISAPGSYERKKDLTPFSIPAGTVVDSHFLHADNVGKAKVRLQGSVTFDADIIGVIITDNNLDASDRLGAVGTRYPNDLKRRGLELPSVRNGGDLVTLSPGLRTLTFNVAFPSVLDQIRVITANAPPSLSIGDVRITEGNRGTKLATFRVRLNYVSGQPVTVNFTTKDGSAFQPGDYATTTGSLTFLPGKTEMTIGVPVVGDTVRESNETFTVELSGAVNATIADGVGLGTIIDNDKRNDDDN